MTDETSLRSGVIEHRIGATGELQVTTTSGDIDVRAVDGETVRIAAADPDDASVLDLFVVEAGEGHLRVRSPRSGFIGVDIGAFKWGRKIGSGGSTDLVVEVPRDAQVTLATVSGDIHAGGLLGIQRYKTISGDIELEDVAGQVDLDGTSGDVRLRTQGSVGLRLRTVSGDIAARARIVSWLELQTMSGDMRIDASLEPGHDHGIETVSGDTRLTTGSGLTIEARTVSGDIRSDVPHRTAIEGGRRSIILGDGRARLAFRSLSGDLQLTGGKQTIAAGEAATWRGERASIQSGPSAPAPSPSLAGRAASASEASTTPGVPPSPPTPDPLETARLEILRALQAGEIDVAAAGERLAALDEDAES